MPYGLLYIPYGESKKDRRKKKNTYFTEGFKKCTLKMRKTKAAAERSSMEPSIKQLVALSLEDKAYTLVLWQRLEPLCLNWVNKLKERDEDAEDLYHESYLLLLKALSTYKAESKVYFETYFKLILFRWGNKYKQKKRTVLIEEKEKGDFWGNLVSRQIGTEEQIICKQQIKTLEEGLNQLTKIERSLLIDFYINGYQIKEIARLYGINHKALESRKRRALKKLKKFFDAF